MKYTILIAFAALLISCGNQTTGSADQSDTTTAKADSMKEKDSEHMTEEVIEASFEKLNR